MIFNKQFGCDFIHYLSDPTPTSPTVRCTSWNGKSCTEDDSVDVGRGPGSCNSNLDCPCCSPFCSVSGYCQNEVSVTEPAIGIGLTMFIFQNN